MKWYVQKLTALQGVAPILSICGDDCAVCPRYLAETDEELHETALFWYRAGWRDHVMRNEEVHCSGCGSRPTCSFALLSCANMHGVEQCRACAEFECSKIADMLKRSDAKKATCADVCESPEEWAGLCRAFYEKEKNLRGTERMESK